MAENRFERGVIVASSLAGILVAYFAWDDWRQKPSHDQAPPSINEPVSSSLPASSACIDLQAVLADPALKRPLPTGSATPTHISVTASTDIARDQSAARQLGEMIQRRNYIIVPADGDLAITIGTVGYSEPQLDRTNYAASATAVVNAGWRGHAPFLAARTICGDGKSVERTGARDDALNATFKALLDTLMPRLSP